MEHCWEPRVRIFNFVQFATDLEHIISLSFILVYFRLRIFPFRKTMPILKRTNSLKSLGIDRKRELYIIKEPEVYLSTPMDLFNVPMIGNRPLYRDDVLFTGHVYQVLENELQVERSLPLVIVFID